MALNMTNSIWVLCETGSGYQPLSYFMYNIARPTADAVKTPEDYMHWLQIWDDARGLIELNVLYPRVKSQKKITVLVYIYDELIEKIEWKHGVLGLFKSEILPILYEIDEKGEYTPFSANKQNNFSYVFERNTYNGVFYCKKNKGGNNGAILFKESRVYEILSELYKSEHWVDLTIFIAIATGRRCIEILKTGSFTKSKRNHLLFEGSMKMKAKDGNNEFIIPTLVSSGKAIKAHEKLKSLLDKKVFYNKKFSELTNKEINSAVAIRLDNKVKSIFNDEAVTFKELRLLYVKLAGDKFDDNIKWSCSRALYTATILGHVEPDLYTQLSYTKWL